MAKKAATPAADPNEHLVVEGKKCFASGEGADQENRTNMADDLKFVYEPGYQWDTTAKSKRQGRPCYTFNRVIGAVNQAIGEQRQVRPSGKVRAVSKTAAAPTAEVYGGMMRSIEAMSRAENIYDNQFKYAVAGAYGAWLVRPAYCDDESFDQELLIEEIPNPFTAMWDHTATDPCKRDARWAIVASRISREQYGEEFGELEQVQNFQANRDSRGWFTNDDVRIAEFFKKICRRSTIAELSDGRIVDYDAKTKKILTELGELGSDIQVPTVERTRQVNNYRVLWCKIDGARVLEGPIEYKWRYIPVVRLPGRYINIEGKQILQSLHRHAKDAQRTYNYHRSTMVETAALTPRAPYLVTSKMIKGREDQWKTLNAVNRPYLEYDIDTTAAQAGVPGGRPYREAPPEVPAALISLAAQDAEDIRQGTGQVGPSDDQQDQNQPESGRARRFRMISGESGAYEFLDNLGKAIQLTWDICIDMIPTVYDTDRVVRTLGIDGVESYVRVNGADPGEFMHQLAKGKYEVTVTLGPAFATARLEALDTLLEAAEKVPLIGQVAPDLIAKNIDVRDGEELHKRVRQELIRQGKVQPTERDQQDMGPPPKPDPVQNALAKQLDAKAERDYADAAKTQAETLAAAIKAHGAPLELQKLIDELVGQRLENMIAAQQLGIGPGGVVTMQRKAESDAGVGNGRALSMG